MGANQKYPSVGSELVRSGRIARTNGLQFENWWSAYVFASPLRLTRNTPPDSPFVRWRPMSQCANEEIVRELREPLLRCYRRDPPRRCAAGAAARWPGRVRHGVPVRARAPAARSGHRGAGVRAGADYERRPCREAGRVARLGGDGDAASGARAVLVAATVDGQHKRYVLVLPEVKDGAATVEECAQRCSARWR